MAPSDATLLQRWVGARDADAFAELVARHAGMVYGTCRRILRNDSEAEDAAQECFLELLRSGGAVRQCLGGWLHAMAVHRSLNRLKSERSRASREQRYAAEARSAVDVDWEDLREHVDAAVAELPEKLRDPLVLRFLEGQTHEAVAATLGIPKSTVRFRIERGIEGVRRALARRGVALSATAGLAALLEGGLAEAAPATLTAKLGVAALAGGPPTVSGIGLTAGVGSLIVKKKVAGGIAALVLVLFLALLQSGESLRQWLGLEGTQEAAEVFPAEDGPGAAPPAVAQASHARRAGPHDARASASPEQTAPPRDAAAPKPVESAPTMIAGRVIAEDGYPFPGATIHLRVTSDVLGFHPRLDREVQTDSTGGYAIEGIAETGVGLVYASASGHATQKYRPLTLSPGAVYDRVDFTLPKGRYFVAGRVVSSRNEPVPGASVHLRHYGYSEGRAGSGTSTAMADFAFAYSGEDGAFEIAVESPGLCDFAVLKDGLGPGFFSGIPTGTENARFELREPGGIAGRVLTRKGEPVAHVRVRAIGKGLPAGVTSYGGSLAPNQLAPVDALTGQDGHYAIDGLGADYHYVVHLAGVDGGGALRTLASLDELSDITPLIEAMVSTPALSPVRTVEVEPGRVTEHVDFTLDPVSKITGRVTDTRSGGPVHPLSIGASLPYGQGDGVEPDILGWASTQTDGSYEMTIAHAQPLPLAFTAVYVSRLGMHSNASPAPATVVDIAPGVDKRVDFSVDAPVTVPVRAVNAAGQPQPGLDLQLRVPGTNSSQGGALLTDAEGRALLAGLPPMRPFVVAALDGSREGASRVRGESEPFMGEPGETLPEQVILCEDRGGIEATLMDGTGQPWPRLPVRVSAHGGDGRTVDLKATTDDAGHLVVLWGLPEGRYPAVSFEATFDGVGLRAEVGELEVTRDQVVDLGALALMPPTKHARTALAERGTDPVE